MYNLPRILTKRDYDTSNDLRGQQTLLNYASFASKISAKSIKRFLSFLLTSSCRYLFYNIILHVALISYFFTGSIPIAWTRSTPTATTCSRATASRTATSRGRGTAGSCPRGRPSTWRESWGGGWSRSWDPGRGRKGGRPSSRSKENTSLLKCYVGILFDGLGIFISCLFYLEWKSWSKRAHAGCGCGCSWGECHDALRLFSWITFWRLEKVISRNSGTSKAVLRKYFLTCRFTFGEKKMY